MGVIVLFWGVLNQSADIRKTAYYLFILMAIVTIPVMMSGEAAEEVLEHSAGMHDLIERHEANAKFGLFGMLMLGIASIIGLVFVKRKQTIVKTIGIIVFVFSLLVTGVMVFIGYEGGKIKHDEIRKESVVMQNNGTYNDTEDDHEHDD